MSETTRPGTAPGVTLLACQCCKHARQSVMAEVWGGKLIIEARLSKVRHFVMLGPDLIDTLEEPRFVYCSCHEADDPARRVLAQVMDDLLVIRGFRHGVLHFLALHPRRLEHLLAQSVAVA